MNSLNPTSGTQVLENLPTKITAHFQATVHNTASESAKSAEVTLTLS
jgi:hypothetical protein